MILEQLTLTNFCIYSGGQVFNFRPDQRNDHATPIVLIGGINGGGKTTLLDAVQLVLYGKRARCSKRNNKSYETFLIESIHQAADPSEGASIQLTFRYAKEGRNLLYEVSRSWSVANNRVRERVQVREDGKVDGWLSDNWNHIVEDLIPFGIAQLCFFDAEKIRFLAEDETSTTALSGAIKALLGLDLAERLAADARVLEGRIVKRVSKSHRVQEIDHLEKNMTTQQTEIDYLVQQLASLENERVMVSNRLKRVEDTFAEVGGHHWEKRREHQNKLNEVENAVQGTKHELVALAATEMPLMLVSDLLEHILQQSNREQLAYENHVLGKMLNKRDLELLKFLKSQGVSANKVKAINEFLKVDRKTRLKPTQIEIRHALSDEARRLLSHLHYRDLEDRKKSAISYLTQLDHQQHELEDIQRSLAATPQDDVIRGITEELKRASSELASITHQINRYERQLANARLGRDASWKKLEQIRRDAIDEELRAEEDSRIVELLTRTQETMKDYLHIATNRKIDRLSELVTQAFRYLLRKKTLVQRVIIDPKTFSITLYDSAGDTILKERLSEGEKQIFAISVLWGLSQASGRSLPAIIDTPMARLDSKHREQLVDRYFPNASHQVVVLSTDTEVDRRYFKSLQKHITRAYHLNYNEKEKATTAEEGYFWA